VSPAFPNITNWLKSIFGVVGSDSGVYGVLALGVMDGVWWWEGRMGVWLDVVADWEKGVVRVVWRSFSKISCMGWRGLAARVWMEEPREGWWSPSPIAVNYDVYE